MGFPIDMLRYDQCWPATSEDVGKMSMTFGRFGEADFRPVTVAAHRDVKAGSFTLERWRSFGWVITGHITSRKI